MKKRVVAGLFCAYFVSAGGLVLAAPSPNASNNAIEARANAGQGRDNAGQPSPMAISSRPSPDANNHNSNANSGGNPKVQIAHCGCNYDGSGLQWKHINVSTRAKGHLRHTAGSSATCIYLEEEVSYVRGADDCRISNGEPSNNIGGLEDCDPVPELATSCEAEAEPPVDDAGVDA